MKRFTKLFLLIFLLLAVAFSIYSYISEGIFYYLLSGDLEKITNYINSFQAYAAVIFVLLVAIEVVLAPLPSLVLYLVGGAIFGTWLGGSLALLGNVIGASIAFFIAKFYGRNFFSKFIDDKKEKIFDSFVNKYGIFSIFFLRVNPFTSSDIFSYLAGLTRMSFWKFILATTLGLAPLIYIQTVISARLVEANPLFAQIFIWLTIAYFVVFILLIFKFRKKDKIYK